MLRGGQDGAGSGSGIGDIYGCLVLSCVVLFILVWHLPPETQVGQVTTVILVTMTHVHSSRTTHMEDADDREAPGVNSRITEDGSSFIYQGPTQSLLIRKLERDMLYDRGCAPLGTPKPPDTQT